MRRVLPAAIVGLALLVGCSGQATLDETSQTPVPLPNQAERSEPAEAPSVDTAPEIEQEPVPYRPAGQPGTAADYAALVERLEQDMPAELRNQAPWPDLRNPNPIVAQVEIFELWIWMSENYPETELVEIMAAPGSPSSEETAAVFGAQVRRNELETRSGQDYQAFDHVVVTFESAGLPLWLGRDVPDDAVVVYYSDNSGPVDVTDRDTGAYITQMPATPTRTWLSIMVPTDVGWQLWRDQLLDPSNGLQVPDVPPPPGRNDEQRTPEL